MLAPAHNPEGAAPEPVAAALPPAVLPVPRGGGGGLAGGGGSGLRAGAYTRSLLGST